MQSSVKAIVFFMCSNFVMFRSAMKTLWITSMLLSSILFTVQASSESRASPSSESSNDVSSVQASSDSVSSSESEICSALRTALEQETDAGSIDVATLLANASLTSLSNQLSVLTQRASTGEVIRVQELEMFVTQLRETVEKLFDECDLDFSLIQGAFDNLLQGSMTSK